MELPVKTEESRIRAPEVVYSPSEIMSKRAAGEITQKEGLVMIQKHLRRYFPQERIVKLIDELCKANDTKSSGIGRYETPNWMARHKGLNEVMKLLSMTEDTHGKNVAPTKMTFNIITNSPVTVEKKEG